jgi:hypothetical protein
MDFDILVLYSVCENVRRFTKLKQPAKNVLYFSTEVALFKIDQYSMTDWSSKSRVVVTWSTSACTNSTPSYVLDVSTFAFWLHRRKKIWSKERREAKHNACIVHIEPLRSSRACIAGPASGTSRQSACLSPIDMVSNYCAWAVGTTENHAKYVPYLNLNSPQLRISLTDWVDVAYYQSTTHLKSTR